MNAPRTCVTTYLVLVLFEMRSYVSQDAYKYTMSVHRLYRTSADTWDWLQLLTENDVYSSLESSSSYIQAVPGRNVPDFGRMFLTLKYTDLTQDMYIRS